MRYAVDAPEVNETLTMIQRLCANPSLPNMKNYLGRVDVLEEATHETLRQIFEDVSTMTEEELDTFAAALTAESINGLDDILLIEQSLDAYCFYSDVTTDEELGKYLVDGGYVNVSEEVERYVNFSMLGADYYATLGGAYGPKGYAQRLTDLNPVFKAYLGSGMVEDQAITFLPLSDRQGRKLTAQLSIPKLEDACVRKLCCASESRQDLEQMPYLESPSVPEADSLARELNRIHKTDGAYLTFLAALEAEQIDTFAGALEIAKHLDDYTRFTGDLEEYGRDAPRFMGAPKQVIDSIEGYMDLEDFGRVMMIEDDVRQTQYGLIRKDWGDSFPRPKQTMEMGGMT